MKYTPFNQCYRKPQAVIQQERNARRLGQAVQGFGTLLDGNPDATWLREQVGNGLASLNPFTPFINMVKHMYIVGTHTRGRGMGRRIF